MKQIPVNNHLVKVGRKTPFWQEETSGRIRQLSGATS